MKYGQYGLVIVLIAMALAGRMLPHPDNFTPVLAVALFGGATLAGGAAFLVPLAAMFASDLALGNGLTWMTLVVYGGFLVGAGLGRWLGKNRTWTRTGVAAVGGSLLFYAVTNFAVWALPGAHAPLYARTLDGLVECYWMALPFLRNSLAGDLFWTAVLFGVFDLARSRMRAPGGSPARTA
jgi:uncharacterized protein DUF6580